MKKDYFYALIMVVLVAMTSCGVPPLDPEEAAKAVLEGERARIPLYMQENELTDLTIDSLRLLTEIEPMEGLLFTTWTYEVTTHKFGYGSHDVKSITTKSVVVEIKDIQRSKEHVQMIQWYSNWDLVGLGQKMDRDNYEF